MDEPKTIEPMTTPDIFTVQDIQEPKKDPQLKMNGLSVPVYLYEVQGSKRLVAAKYLYNEYDVLNKIDPEIRDCILQYVDRYNTLSEQADRQGALMLDPFELVMQSELNRALQRLQVALQNTKQQ